MHNQTPTLSRAQGEQSIPWAADIAGEPETCCVALRVEVTEDRVDDDVAVLDDRPRVGVGEPAQTLRHLINHGLEGAGRDVLLAELDAIGWIDPRCPLVLERLHVSGGRAMHVEALILPVACEQVSELDDLLRDESDPDTRHGLGWLYAEDLAELWRGAAAPDGRLPVRFLEDAIDQESPAQQPVGLLAPVAQAAGLACV
jgi:hypothetical protein